MIGTAFWWWKRPERGADDGEMAPGADPGDAALDDLIARLDEARERSELKEDEYRQERMRLRSEAKKLL